MLSIEEALKREGRVSRLKWEEVGGDFFHDLQLFSLNFGLTPGDGSVHNSSFAAVAALANHIAVFFAFPGGDVKGIKIGLVWHEHQLVHSPPLRVRIVDSFVRG